MSSYDNFSVDIKDKLDSMYNNEKQLGSDGKLHDIDKHTRIFEDAGMDLHDLTIATNAKSTLEIGLAYGFSTLFFLEALRQTKGTHTAIDPAQHGYWKGIGYTSARQLAKSPFGLQFHLGTSYEVLPIITRNKRMFDVIFIDGNHKFDDVLVDFVLCAPLCKLNGYIVLDDFLMPSINKVSQFILKNRKDFMKVETRSINLAAFKKISNIDTRSWDYHEEF